VTQRQWSVLATQTLPAPLAMAAEAASAIGMNPSGEVGTSPSRLRRPSMNGLSLYSSRSFRPRPRLLARAGDCRLARPPPLRCPQGLPGRMPSFGQPARRDPRELPWTTGWASTRGGN
jgi:hypothetical protein